MASGRLLKCSGSNYSIALDFTAHEMVIHSRGIQVTKPYKLPVDRIRAVVLQRKSVVPFATMMVMSLLTTLILKYNGLWPLIKLTSENIAKSSMICAIVTVILALPTLSRILFVNISVTWDGEPISWLIRFVPARSGRRLVRAFPEMSNEN